MSKSIASFTGTAPRPAVSALLTVDAIGDVACPFSFLGKRRLDKALEAVQGPVEKNWYPWQLNSELPADGMAFDEYLVERFGSAEAVEPVLENLKREGKAVGIDFRFDRIERMPNTLRAHQLLYLAESRGLDAVAMADDILSAFFEQGRDIGDVEVLAKIGLRHGILTGDVIAATENEKTRAAVLACERQVRESGVAAVPAFLLNRRLLV
ncbi:MAG: DsbA family oxidoreductase, partial [Pseudomonadota bacterium]